MSATLQDEPLLSLDVEELAPVTFRRAVEVTSNSEPELKSLLARGYSGTHEQSTPFHSFLEHSTLFLFPFVFGPALYVSLARLYHFDVLWSVLLAIPLGIIAGDFVSGIVHWFADTYFTEKTPIIDRKSTRLNSSHSQISYAVF